MMGAGKLHRGYVRGDRGTWAVQIPTAGSRFGFHILTDDQCWDGGIDFDGGWTAIAETNVPARVKARLGYLLEERE
jgi:hypothetical protein